MKEASRKSKHPTSKDSSNATSSPASGRGLTLFDSLDGLTTGSAGPEAAPAQVSRVRVKEKGLTTLVTSGRSGIPSSASVALESSLVNRLMQRLDTAGSTLFRQTWKRRSTPLRRRYWEHTASAQGINDSGCTFVPTPNAMEGGQTSRSGKRKGEMLMGGIVKLATIPTPDNPNRRGGGQDPLKRRASGHAVNLQDAVSLASVPTPMAGSPATETYNAAGNNDYSRKIVELASVAIPKVRDFKSASASASFLAPQMAHPRGKDLSVQATYFETGVDPDGSIRSRLDQLPRQAQLADSGETATGGTPATGSTGQLNPDYSRWLMGLPIVFSSCADTAMQSFRKLRKRSSGRT